MLRSPKYAVVLCATFCSLTWASPAGACSYPPAQATTSIADGASGVPLDVAPWAAIRSAGSPVLALQDERGSLVQAEQQLLGHLGELAFVELAPVAPLAPNQSYRLRLGEEVLVTFTTGDSLTRENEAVSHRVSVNVEPTREPGCTTPSICVGDRNNPGADVLVEFTTRTGEVRTTQVVTQDRPLVLPEQVAQLARSEFCIAVRTRTQHGRVSQPTTFCHDTWNATAWSSHELQSARCENGEFSVLAGARQDAGVEGPGPVGDAEDSAPSHDLEAGITRADDGCNASGQHASTSWVLTFSWLLLTRRKQQRRVA